MKPRIRFIAIVAALATVGFTSACQRSQAAAAGGPPAAPEIPVVRVVSQTVPDSLQFTGHLDALHRIELRPRVTGAISAIHFKEGEIVRADDALFEIDPRPYRIRRDQAAAELARANAASVRAQQENARARALRATEAISVEDFEQHAADASAAEATRNAAQAALAAADLELEFTTVRAPVAGRMSRALATLGNLAAADRTVLATLVSVESMRVRFMIDEPTFHRLLIAPPRAALSARVSTTGSDRAFAATVDYLGNSVDTATGTVEVRATLESAGNALFDGMFARVELHLPAEHGRMLVPETALGAEQGSRYVLVADAENKLVHRKVTLGPRVGNQRAISSGVDAGEYIVVAGLQFLRPGMTIRPVNAPSNTLAQHASN